MIQVKIQGKLFEFLETIPNSKQTLEMVKKQSFEQKRGVGSNYLAMLNENHIGELRSLLEKAKSCCHQNLKNKDMDMKERQHIHYLLRKIQEVVKNIPQLSVL